MKFVKYNDIFRGTYKKMKEKCIGEKEKYK